MESSFPSCYHWRNAHTVMGYIPTMTSQQWHQMTMTSQQWHHNIHTGNTEDDIITFKVSRGKDTLYYPYNSRFPHYDHYLWPKTFWEDTPASIISSIFHIPCQWGTQHQHESLSSGSSEHIAVECQQQGRVPLCVHVCVHECVCVCICMHEYVCVIEGVLHFDQSRHYTYVHKSWVSNTQTSPPPPLLPNTHTHHTENNNSLHRSCCGDFFGDLPGESTIVTHSFIMADSYRNWTKLAQVALILATLNEIWPPLKC